MNVKTTFVHGYLDEELYMGQPKRFMLKGEEYKICKLQRSFMVLGKHLKVGTSDLTKSYKDMILNKIQMNYVFTISKLDIQ